MNKDRFDQDRDGGDSYPPRRQRKKAHRVAKFATNDPLYVWNQAAVPNTPQMNAVNYQPPNCVVPQIGIVQPQLQIIQQPQMIQQAPAVMQVQPARSPGYYGSCEIPPDFANIVPKSFDIVQRGNLPRISFGHGKVELSSSNS